VFSFPFARLARRFFDVIFPPRATDVLVRNVSFETLRQISAPRIVRIENVPILTLLSYRLPLIQALVTEAKFERNRHAQALLGELLADYIKVSLMLMLLANEMLIVVPLPLGKARRRQRGYNQVEEVAKVAVGKLTTQGLKVELAPDVLVRTRETASQTSLGREARLQNMKGPFGVRGGVKNAAAPAAQRHSRTYLLLDDVVTTGATLLSAHKALAQLSQNRIVVLALAH
jgi:predicted amidophosphoribosyltransferase